MLLQRELHVARNHLLLEHQIAHAVIIVGIALQVVPLHPVHRHVGPVAHLIHRQENIIYRINSGIEQYIMADAQRLDGRIEPLDHLIHIELAARHTEREMVRLHTAAYPPPIRKNGLEIDRCRLQYQIACLHMEQIIDDLEAADIEIDDGIAGIAVLLHECRRLLVENLAVVHACQLIALDIAVHLHDLLVLRHLLDLAPLIFLPRHDILYAAAHDGRVIRLHDEIRRAHLHRLGLAAVIIGRRHDDDRYIHVVIAALHARQHLEAIHDRHHEIDQHDGYRLLVYDTQSLFSVRGFDYCIFILEELSQHDTIDFHIIDDQHHRLFFHNIAFLAGQASCTAIHRVNIVHHHDRNQQIPG